MMRIVSRKDAPSAIIDLVNDWLGQNGPEEIGLVELLFLDELIHQAGACQTGVTD
jgi:hypothetical protein